MQRTNTIPEIMKHNKLGALILPNIKTYCKYYNQDSVVLQQILANR